MYSWPETPYVDQTGLKLRRSSCFCLLRLKVCTTTSNHLIFFLAKDSKQNFECYDFLFINYLCKTLTVSTLKIHKIIMSYYFCP